MNQSTAPIRLIDTKGERVAGNRIAVMHRIQLSDLFYALTFCCGGWVVRQRSRSGCCRCSARSSCVDMAFCYTPPSSTSGKPVKERSFDNPFLIGNGNCTTVLAACAAGLQGAAGQSRLLRVSLCIHHGHKLPKHVTDTPLLRRLSTCCVICALHTSAWGTAISWLRTMGVVGSSEL